MSKVIEIIVSPTGETRLETKGFAGVECKAASKFVEQALGAATGEQITAECHQSQPVQHQNREAILRYRKSRPPLTKPALAAA